MISYFVPSKIRFTAFGDWGMKTPSRDLILSTLELMRFELDFCVLLGDNFYPDGVQSVDDPQWQHGVVDIFPPSLRLYAVLGNHDYHANAHAQVVYTYLPRNTLWKMPYYYYMEQFPVGNETLDMFFLDTAILSPFFTMDIMRHCGVGSYSLQMFQQNAQNIRNEHIRWLQTHLSQSRARWKVVCGHYPIASGGPHPVSPVLENLLFPLFEKYGVDVYFSGHDHNAQVLQKNSVLCVVSGCASMVVPPPRPNPKTLFVSTVPGQFVTEVTATTLDLHYVEGVGKISFQHSLVKKGK